MASKNERPGGEVTIYDPGEYEGRPEQSSHGAIATARVSGVGASFLGQRGFSGIERVDVVGRYRLFLNEFSITNDNFVAIVTPTRSPAGVNAIIAGATHEVGAVLVDIVEVVGGTFIDKDFDIAVFRTVDVT